MPQVMVRTEANTVWKALVDNTPSMLRRILPRLTAMLLTALSSGECERRQVPLAPTTPSLFFPLSSLISVPAPPVPDHVLGAIFWHQSEGIRAPFSLLLWQLVDNLCGDRKKVCDSGLEEFTRPI